MDLEFEIDGMSVTANPERMFRALALDGPFNGNYITVREAHENGYSLAPWSETQPEPVWLHNSYVSPELEETITEAVAECEIR